MLSLCANTITPQVAVFSEIRELCRKYKKPIEKNGDIQSRKKKSENWSNKIDNNVICYK